MPRTTREGSGELVVVEINLKDSTIANMSIPSGNLTRELIVIHMKVLELNHVEGGRKASSQGVVTNVKVKHGREFHPIRNRSAKVVVVYIEVAWLGEEKRAVRS